MSRYNDYFQHYAEVIKDDGEEITSCTIVRTDGTNCLYEIDSHGETMRGWWRDGESIGDINWQLEPRDGWPTNLS